MYCSWICNDLFIAAACAGKKILRIVTIDKDKIIPMYKAKQIFNGKLQWSVIVSSWEL